METKLIQAYNLPDGYHESLIELNKCKEKEMTVIINIYNPLAEPMISKCFMGTPYSLEQYRQEMLYGILDFEVEQGLWHYTYHQRFAPYLKFIIDELRRDPKSRRAVIAVRDNEADAYNENPACLQSIQYQLRDNKLDCQVLFRSNDAVKAAFMNMFALIMLQKKIADELYVRVGEYTHIANNYHCHEKDIPTLENYCKRIKKDYQQDTDDSSYNYKGCWDMLMEAEKPAIAEMVAEQKRKARINNDKEKK